MARFLGFAWHLEELRFSIWCVVSSYTYANKRARAHAKDTPDRYLAQCYYLQHRRSQLTTAILMYTVVAGYFYSALWFYYINRTDRIIFANFHTTLIILGLCLIPVYLLAGADYSEFAETSLPMHFWQGGRIHTCAGPCF